MTNESTQSRKFVPQFSLWTLGIILPTIAGLVFAIYANRQHQYAVRDRLVESHEVLQAERDRLRGRVAQLTEIRNHMDAELAKWSKPEAVIQRLQNPDVPPLDINNRGSGYFPLDDASDLFYFFVQADELKVRELIAQMKAAYPGSSRLSQYQMLNLLARWPQFAPDTLAAISDDVKPFLEPIRNDSNSILAGEAKAAWRTFGGSNEVQNNEFNRRDDGESEETP